MSELTVCKAGGGLMKDPAAINRFVQKVQSDPRRRIIVPSAPGSRGPNDPKMTGLLLDYTKGMPRRRACLDASVYGRFCSIMRQLKPSVELGRDLNNSMKWWPCLSADAIASRGEYWMGRILAELLDFEFIDATRIIRFDENGRFDLEATRKNAHVITEALARSKGVVMPGFYGLTPDGMTIKTLPRNATDLSAAIVADLAGASLLEIWKETCVRLASPKIVTNPRATLYLNCEEGIALTDRGSEVVYSSAIELMRDAEIPIHVIGINDPAGEMTVIDSAQKTPGARDGSISGIASHTDMSILTIKRHGMHQESGVIGKAFDVLGNLDVRVHHPLDGIDTVDAIVETKKIEGILAKIAVALEERFGSVELLHKPERALITVVGRGLNGLKPRIRIMQALVSAGVEDAELTQGSEKYVFTLTVPMATHETVIRALYRDFA